MKNYSQWIAAEKKRQQMKRLKAESSYQRTKRPRFRREAGVAGYMEAALDAAERELKGEKMAKDIVRRQMLGVYNWAADLAKTMPPDMAVKKILEEIHAGSFQR